MTSNEELLDYMKRVERDGLEAKPPKPHLTKEQLARPLCFADQLGLMKSIAPVIGDFVFKAMEPLRARIKELEARPATKYLGVHERGRAYEVGNFVTKNGGIWHCDVPTRQAPGSCGDWTLAVKSGERR
jgi:hypothetical protein